MVKSLFIFGNGLGRAISNHYFSLERVLRDAWDDDDVLSERQKHLIRSCLPHDVLEGEDIAPTSEPDLENLQRVLSACDTIRQFEDQIAGTDGNWLNEHGMEFPTAIRRYLHNAACRFNQPVLGVDRALPNKFQKKLRGFIMHKGGHIATLNYDDLLYECFTDTDVFKKHRLRDGFFNRKFNFAAHETWYKGKNEGWFLHLHGSPLFMGPSDQPEKITRAELDEKIGHDSTHLVLTSVQHKRAAIQSSEILKTYWDKLQQIIPESTNVVLFGYGGLDVHLNEQLRHLHHEADLRIVEYDDGADLADREKFWRAATGRKNLGLIRMQNILNFDLWDAEIPF